MPSSYSASDYQTFDPRAFALKGGLFPLTLLEILKDDVGELRRELMLKAKQAPDFFKQAPAVLSVDNLPEKGQVDLAAIKQLCQEAGLIIVALRESEPELNARARDLNMAVLPKSRARTVGHQPTELALPAEGAAAADESVPAPPGTRKAAKKGRRATRKGGAAAAEVPVPSTPAPVVAAPPVDIPVLTDATTKLITTPIRSGQQVYAAGGDLIVAAPVSAGAELLADGNIHVYGALRGRALAGVKGNEKARIFCQSMEAELVSISGNFKLEENPSTEYRNRPVMIYLEEKVLKVKPLTPKDR